MQGYLNAAESIARVPDSGGEKKSRPYSDELVRCKSGYLRENEAFLSSGGRRSRSSRFKVDGVSTDITWGF